MLREEERAEPGDGRSARGTDGQQDLPQHRPPGGSVAWFRLGASAVAGVALGALLAAASPFHPAPLARPAGGTPQLDARLQLGPQAPVQSVRFDEPRPASNPGPSTQQR
jgi:hypothetical protein